MSGSLAVGGIHRWLLGVFCTARSDVPAREEGREVRVERERREGSRGTVGAGDLLNDSQNVSKFLQLQFWLQEHQSHEPIREQDSKLRNLISSHD